MLIDTMLRNILLLCLACTLLADAANAQSPPQARRLQDLTLDSGLTLDDWVRVTRSKEPVPSVATGVQAAAFVRRYGPYRELLDIVWRAAQHKDLQRETIDRSNAAERLTVLTEARRALGDWPSLLMASAAARSYLGDAAGATADLRRWMALASASDASRGRVAEVLLSVAQKPDAVMAWLTQSGLGAIPVALRRPVDPYFDRFAKEIARVRECLGPVELFDDLAILTEGHWASANPMSFLSTFRMTALGLPLATHAFQGQPGSGLQEVEQTIASPFGAGWSFNRTRSDDAGYTSERYASIRDFTCNTPILPGGKGKLVELAWESEASSQSNLSSGRKLSHQSVTRQRATIEYLSDAMSAVEVQVGRPQLKLNLPQDFQARFYLMRFRYSSEDITPPAPGKERTPPTQTELEAVFIEGPNAMLRMDAGSGWKPGTVWTVSRPAADN